MRRIIAAILLSWPTLAIAGSAYTPAKTATTTGYTVGSGANWTDPDPTTTAAALDTLAARVPAAGALGGSIGAADNRVLRSDGVGGATIQASPLECTDAGDVSGVAGLTLSGNITLSTGGATVDGVDVGAIPSTYQPLDAMLTSAAALDGTGGDKGVYLTAADTAATFALTAAGRALADDASAAAQRATLSAALEGTCGLDTFVTATADDGAPTCSAVDASVVTFTPGVLANWTGSADPGDGDAALDQLALRLATEEAVSQSGTGACGASQWASTLNSDAAPTCSQPAFSDLSGAATDAQVPDTITVSLAATATALAANPTDCAADALANSIDAAGALTCYAVPDCDNATTSKLLYDTTTHAFSCGTDQAGGAVDASVVTYTPIDTTDWTSNLDPGDVDNALDQLAQRVTDGGPAHINYQAFSAGSGTWTKPAGCTWVEAYLQGGGGGGGSGRWDTSGNRYGGGGGGGGGYTRAVIACSLFSSTETVTVGSGGTGGAAATSGTDGNAGADGGDTSMGTMFYAEGGTGGGAGTSASGTAGAGGRGDCAGGDGSAGVIGSSAPSAGSASSCGKGAGGGAGGAGISSAPASSGNGAAGGAGASSYYAYSASTLAGGAGGVSANADRSGTAGASIAGGIVLGGAGGGSGGARAATGGDGAAGGGGNGGTLGGGGGGSGALGFAGTARAGGNGGNGYAIIISHF